MRFVLFLLLVSFCSACASPASIKQDLDVVTFSAKVIKAEVVEREHAGPFMAFIPLGKGVGLVVPGSGTTVYSHKINMYTLKIAGRSHVEVDSTSSFSVGQCVLLYVKEFAAGHSRLFPTVAYLEPQDHCADHTDKTHTTFQGITAR